MQARLRKESIQLMLYDISILDLCSEPELTTVDKVRISQLNKLETLNQQEANDALHLIKKYDTLIIAHTEREGEK